MEKEYLTRPFARIYIYPRRPSRFKPEHMRKFSYFESYFYYTRTERNACTTLVFLIVVFFYLPAVYSILFPNRERTDFTEFQAEIAAFQADRQAAKAAENASQADQNDLRTVENAAPPEPFFFDPNTATKEDFVELGISPGVAQVILNYRSKGGKFFKKEDFKKIYVLRQEDYERLEDWIKIENQAAQVAENERLEKKKYAPVSPENGNPSAKFQAPSIAPASLDVNAATAEDWQKLKGIGAFYAKRIVNFREKLGGFSSIQQVGETFGLPDSTFQKIQPFLKGSPVFRKIKVNSATLEELKSHPYLSNFQATVLFNYRQQHGNFANLESLKKLTAAFKDSDWARLEPYFSCE